MRRREFLRATVLTAGGLVIGCGTKASTPAVVDASGALDASGGDSILLSDASTADSLLDAAADTGAVAVDVSQWFPQSVCSGDPKVDSVILWTRVVDASQGSEDLPVLLEVSTDSSFAQVIALSKAAAAQVVARGQHDHCVKVKVTGLQANTLYYYRFTYAAAGKAVVSRVGRVQTAPAADADVDVKFAFVSCQDYNGKYYNCYQRLAQEDLAFFVHLGDYVYETTGDPSFQVIDPNRRVTFADPASALAFNVGTANQYYAAQSLSNYRDLYKVYRSDQDLQQVHERFAMIAVGDDHEFSDDCWQQNANYTDGLQNEFSPARRGAADEAWYEYMPVDFVAGGADGSAYTFDPVGKFPDNLQSYRSFQFGKHVSLVMTDLRRYRSDHLIAEDAAPGAVAVQEAALKSLTSDGNLPSVATPYFDLTADLAGVYGVTLQAHVDKIGGDPKRCKGLFTVAWVNGALADLGKAGVADLPTAIADAQTATMKKGLGFHQLFKNSWNSSLGSRYLVVADTFRLYAKARWNQSQLSQTAMGDVQEKWFIDTLKAATTTWKIWGNEYTFQQRIVDLSPLSLPDAFKQRFCLSAEDWDGLPDRRESLVKQLAALGNVVIVSGDIHAFFAGTPQSEDGTAQVIEFVGGAISSGTYQSMLVNQASSDPTLNAAGGAALAYAASSLLLGTAAGSKHSNPNLAYADLAQHGVSVVQASATELAVTFLQTPEATAAARLSAGDVAKAFSAQAFKVKTGAADLYHQDQGAWKVWDPKTFAWK